MKKLIKIMFVALIIIAVFWTALTLFAEIAGGKRIAVFGNPGATRKAMIIYDPDPFYNLDQQVCESFAKGLATNGWFVQVMSVASAKEIDVSQFNLYVFCANTYNWSPDWSVARFIKKHVAIKGKNVAAITLGAGSTRRSQRVLEDLIKESGANLLASRAYWLWRPNDRSRLKESNVKVAVELAHKFAEEMFFDQK